MIAHVGYGLVEGFYGPPWSAATRAEVVRLLATAGLTTYFYAPKSDPSHRDRWWAPLLEGERAELSRLFEVAREVGVRVVYGIAPERLMVSGNLRVRTARDLSSEGMQRLLARLADVASLGGRDFAVLFDDTLTTLVPWLGGAAKGRAHGLVTNAVREMLARRWPDASLFVVPAIYHRRASEASASALAYARALASTIGEVPAAWTGPRIFSRWISAEDATAWQRATGLTTFVWDNQIANDWLPLASGETVGARGLQRLSFGPIDNLAPGVVAACRGVLVNGAREPWLSVISAMTLGDLLREGTRYAPEPSYDRAIARVAGAPAVDVIKELHALVWRHPLAAPHRGRMLGIADQIGDVIRGRRPSERAAVLERLARLSTVEQRIAASLAAHPLLAELRPTALKVELLARAIREVLAGGAEGPALALRARRIPWQTDFDETLARIR